jgi:hypothetical protein
VIEALRPTTRARRRRRRRRRMRMRKPRTRTRVATAEWEKAAAAAAAAAVVVALIESSVPVFSVSRQRKRRLPTTQPRGRDAPRVDARK